MRVASLESSLRFCSWSKYSEERIIERMAKRIEAKLMASLESRFRSATGESSSAGVPGTSETGVAEKRKEGA